MLSATGLFESVCENVCRERGLLNEVKFLRSLARSVEEGGWFNGGTRGDWIDLLSNA